MEAALTETLSFTFNGGQSPAATALSALGAPLSAMTSYIKGQTKPGGDIFSPTPEYLPLENPTGDANSSAKRTPPPRLQRLSFGEADAVTVDDHEAACYPGDKDVAAPASPIVLGKSHIRKSGTFVINIRLSPTDCEAYLPEFPVAKTDAADN